MGEIVFIGMGLCSEKDLTLEGIEEAKKAQKVFIELYTSLMPGLNIERLEKLIGKSIEILTRKDLEDNMHLLINQAKKQRIAILSPGDPFIATTHIALRIEAEKLGIRTKVINGVSIITAIPGATGLHSYKFGKSVTLTFPISDKPSYTVYEATKENLSRGLHTLILLEIDVEKRRYMTINYAIDLLSKLELTYQEGVFKEDRLIVGLARLGCENMVVRADSLIKLKDYDFGPPPHSLIVPGSLHFMEAEALKILASAPEEVLRGVISRQ